MPTHGHTPGYHSAGVRADKGTGLVLVADACYTPENMDGGASPNTLWDLAEMSRSQVKRRGLRGRQVAIMIYGHDVA